jgi:hypothetical protein
VYAVWTRNEFPQEQAAPIAADTSAASRGPVWFGRSIDGGRTWQAAHEIYDPGELNGTLGHQIVVLPTSAGFHGELVDVFEVSYGSSNAHGQRGVHIAAIRSTDKGTTWSDATEIADALPVPFVDPLTGTRIRTGANIPDIAIDSRNGTLYAAWLDARFSGGQHNDIALSMSTDGGLTWTAPVRANLTPSVAEPVSRNAFTPSVQVSADGTVGVSSYDLRNNHSVDSATQPLATDRFLARCARPSASVPDLCASGWTETRLTPDSFNLRAAPNSVGLFLGGNQGLASVGNTFLALFAQANDAADPTTIYFASVP